jgi:hypothetical protein
MFNYKTKQNEKTYFNFKVVILASYSSTTLEKNIPNQFYEKVKTELLDPTSYSFVSIEKNNDNIDFISYSNGSKPIVI